MTRREVIWTRPALQELRRLAPPDAVRVREGISRLAETGRGDLRRLKGTDAVLAPRVADWRVWFELDSRADAVVVLHVRHRREAYR